ncbi:hypothetical protein HDU83_004059 [Entophlyctis luteolus]|nr:hypothetical protein HDU83_004059 [Entophlyctis luteolus]KAJ3378442.1 hypothetical protein HDU84_007564 [Entophlyctis sp. JEL0112]
MQEDLDSEGSKLSNSQLERLLESTTLASLLKPSSANNLDLVDTLRKVVSSTDPEDTIDSLIEENPQFREFANEVLKVVVGEGL